MQYAARKNAEVTAVGKKANAYPSDAFSELQYTKGLLNMTINERDEVFQAVYNFNLAVSHDTRVVRIQNWNFAARGKKVWEIYGKDC